MFGGLLLAYQPSAPAFKSRATVTVWAIDGYLLLLLLVAAMWQVAREVDFASDQAAEERGLRVGQTAERARQWVCPELCVSGLATLIVRDGLPARFRMAAFVIPVILAGGRLDGVPSESPSTSSSLPAARHAARARGAPVPEKTAPRVPRSRI